MQDYRTTVLVSTPSFAFIVADRLEKLGIDPKALNLKEGLFGGEAWTEKTRKEIEGALFIEAFDNYGVSELMGPGIPVNALRKRGSTSSRTISCRRSSTREAETRCPRERRESWS